MNKLLLLLLGFLACLLISFSKEVEMVTPIQPADWPTPIYDLTTITDAGFELGRTLFYDPNLSMDSSISCANCHLQFTGFTHVDHAVSHGIEGRKGTRNSPALINLAWNNSFHWDGGVNHLDVQGLNPIQHPKEMDNTLENVLTYLNASEEYRVLFYKTFEDSIPTTPNVLKALSQFTASLISANSKYDQYVRKEATFTDQEKNGLKLFRKHCASCHTEPLFNTNEFKSNGLSIDSQYNDLGRYLITTVGKDSLQFRVPTLRNIEHTFPYMHDGRFKKLKDVITHYATLDTDTPYLSKELKKQMHLSEHDQKDLIAFLYTLTDREFLYNKRFSFPR